MLAINIYTMPHQHGVRIPRKQLYRSMWHWTHWIRPNIKPIPLRTCQSQPLQTARWRVSCKTSWRHSKGERKASSTHSEVSDSQSSSEDQQCQQQHLYQPRLCCWSSLSQQPVTLHFDFISRVFSIDIVTKHL